MKPLVLKITTYIITLFLISGYTNQKTNTVKTIEYYGNAANKNQLLSLLKKEITAKRKPVLYFTATWCAPCKAFKNSLTNQLMIDALEDATLITIDADIDALSERIALKYAVKSYPTYIRVDETGKLLLKIDGSAWQEDVPKNMAPVLKNFMKN
jgi:thiol-disulfide isomerase/thioredoxin